MTGKSAMRCMAGFGALLLIVDETREVSR
jgi:hypothetical protein